MRRAVVVVMVGVLSCVLADNEDAILNKNATSSLPGQADGSGGAVVMSKHRAQAMSIIKKLAKIFRPSNHHKKAVPVQYRWLSEGPNGLSIASNQIKTSKKVEKKEKSKVDVRKLLQNQFRFHVSGTRSTVPVLDRPLTGDDNKGNLTTGPSWTTWIVRPKGMPPLAPTAREVSLVVRKKNRKTKEIGYYIFENLESLIKHNKLHDFRLTPIDMY